MLTTTAPAGGDPRALALLTAGVVGRLPAGMVPVAVLLAARGGGSVALGATATAVVALSTAAAGPFAGRLVDRGAAPTVLAVTAALYPLAVAALAWAARTGDVGALLAAAALVGVLTPPVGPLVRAALPRLVPDHALGRVFAAEAASTELVWIVGPLLVAASTALASAEVALLTAGAAGSIGALACRPLASRSFGPVPSQPRPLAIDTELVQPPTGSTARSAARTDATVPAAGGSPSVRRRLGVVLGGDALSGMAIGILIVALAEAMAAAGAAGASGVVIALWSVGSLLGGIATGARPARHSLARRYTVSMALLAAATLPLVAASSAGVPSVRPIAAAALVAGLPLAVVAASANGLIAELVPAAARTEAFAWSAATVAVAGAAGSALAGPLLAVGGVAAAATAAAVLLAVASAFVAAGRTMLEPRCTPKTTLASHVCVGSPMPMAPISST